MARASCEETTVYHPPVVAERPGDGFERLYETARALGEDTRFRVYRAVCLAGAPVSVTALAESFSLHPNAIRQHLARLEQAGLVTSRPDRGAGGAGRPRRLYEPSAEPSELTQPPRGTRALVALLAEAVDSLPSSDEERLSDFGRAWGRTWGARRKRENGASPRSRRARAELLRRELAGWGWRPQANHDRDGVRIATGRCLFREAAPGVNGRCCALEQGVLRGIVDALAGGHASVVKSDGCRLDVRVS